VLFLQFLPWLEGISFKIGMMELNLKSGIISQLIKNLIVEYLTNKMGLILLFYLKKASCAAHGNVLMYRQVGIEIERKKQ
jgi:hypothetical protein